MRRDLAIKSNDQLIWEIEDILEEIKSRMVEPVFPINKFLYHEISDMHLNFRSEACLRFLNVKYIGDLVQLRKRDLLKQPNFGNKSLGEIVSCVEKLGLTFNMQLENWPPENIEELSKRASVSKPRFPHWRLDSSN